MNGILKELILMVKIKIDDVEYDTDDLSDNAKAQVASLQFNDMHMQRLRKQRRQRR